MERERGERTGEWRGEIRERGSGPVTVWTGSVMGVKPLRYSGRETDTTSGRERHSGRETDTTSKMNISTRSSFSPS